MLAYFDCFSGISGDMTLAALLDLGVPLSWLNESLQKIPLNGFDLHLCPVARNGIHSQQLTVAITDTGTSRHYTDIRSLIDQSPLSGQVKAQSLAIFEKIAEAEAGIHGCAKAKVHFHEVGGVDALVDIVGTCLCLEYLDIKTIYASSIPLGRGFVTCQHGTLPVPAPATVAILKGVPVYGTQIQHEIVTPTGAAIIASLAQQFGEMPAMQIAKTGYGAGSREFESQPNLLRIITGTPTSDVKEPIMIVEATIDDMNPEIFGYLMERLFADGALDVCWIPVFMKKNRPGTLVQVLCKPERRDTLVQRILTETTSLGVRFYPAARSKLHREQVRIPTVYGQVQVKRIQDSTGGYHIVPEYEVCRQIALERKLPLRTVYEMILKNLPGDVQIEQYLDKHGA